jgi:hypothetical protein
VIIDRGTAGNPKTTWRVPGSAQWQMGLDASDSNKFKISSDTGGALGTSTQLTLDSSSTTGRLGLGTSSPSYDLDITKADTSVSVMIQNTSSTSQRYPSLFARNFAAATRGYPTITLGTARGSLSSPSGVLTDDPLGQLKFQATYDTSGTFADGGSITTYAGEDWSSSNRGTYMVFSTVLKGTNTIAEQMRIHSNGNVGVGVTNPSYKLDVNGDANISSLGALRFNGTSVCTSSGCTSSSDRRLKENISPLENSLDKILKLQGVEYDWKDKQRFSDKHQIGLIAQDLEEVYPEVVVTDTKTGLKSVAYDHLIAPVIEAIKTLNSMINQLYDSYDSRSKEIESLKAENARLKARLDRIEKSMNSK